MKRLLLPFALVLSAYAEGCLPVSGDRITGRDLALANPAFAALPATLTVAYAPVPGTRRVFAQAELVRVARANHINASNPAEVCFEIPMRQIEDTDVLSSMRRSLTADVELSLVELPKTTVPAGRVEFPLSGLEPEAKGVRIWRGYVGYGETLRMRIWARVKVCRRVQAVVAAADLALNVPIGAAHLRLETVSTPIGPEQRVAQRMDEVLGRVPRKAVAAGSTIPLAILDTPPTVRRGDAVKVEVRSGPARIQIDAIAEKAARPGDMLELRNPASGKVFRARLEGGAKATIVVGAGQSL
jgi:flagella basal body P-ring formation protein FlgA